MLRTIAVFALFVAGCSAAPAEEGSTTEGEEQTGESMDAISTGGCSTSTVLGLSTQLIAEANCIRPGTFSRYTGAGITLASSAAFPYLQTPAANALRRAVAGGDNLTINSALRTLPQQYLLYTWYRRGQCGISLAARSGSSPHERGRIGRINQDFCLLGA
jgi:hypothetical protein